MPPAITPSSPIPHPTGHRIKSKDNRDKRVELLQVYARKHFPAVRFLEYAITVEEYTLQKVCVWVGGSWAGGLGRQVVRMSPCLVLSVMWDADCPMSSNILQPRCISTCA